MVSKRNFASGDVDTNCHFDLQNLVLLHSQIVPQQNQQDARKSNNKCPPQSRVRGWHWSFHNLGESQ